MHHTSKATRPILFSRFPELSTLPWTALADLPTPVQPLEGLGRAIGLPALYIKREDLSSTFYGGNKVRKLEFLLADLQRRGTSKVITFGAVGSNWILALAAYGNALGIRVEPVMVNQPFTHGVRRNILAGLHFGIDPVMVPHALLAPLEIAKRLNRNRRLEGAGSGRGRTAWLPMGGTTPLGMLGPLTGALELAEQVRAGLVPEPDYLFVPLGSCGTAAGNHVGLRLAGLGTKVVAVRVVDAAICNHATYAFHCNHLIRFMVAKGVPSERLRPVAPWELTVLYGHFGKEYGGSTAGGKEAKDLVEAHEQVRLEQTYTAKAMAGLIDEVRRGKIASHKVVLFWHTYNTAAIDRFVHEDPELTAHIRDGRLRALLSRNRHTS